MNLTKGAPMSGAKEQTVLLKDRQMTYLQEMADKHGLADASKALRCIIDFAITDTAQESRIFTEIRCNDC